MATSGTVGATTLNVQKVIEDACRKCKVPAPQLTPEINQVARRNLYYYLSGLVNRSLLLWAIEPTIVGLLPGQLIYPLPRGTVDLLNTNYATTSLLTGTATSSDGGTASNAFDQDITTYCLQTAANGNISLLLPGALYCNAVGFMAYGEQTYTLVWEFSDDGITWNELLATDAETYPNRKWVYKYVTNPRSALYFRVRETNGGTLSVIEIAMVNSFTEVPITALSRDNYSNLPNKNFQQRQITQYFFRRTRQDPAIYTWAVPTNFMDTLTLFRSRQIEDVGELTDEVEIPQYWAEATTWQLAARMAPDLQSVPNVPKLDGAYLAYIQQLAEKFEREAADETRDNAPVFFAPLIGVYTA